MTLTPARLATISRALCDSGIEHGTLHDVSGPLNLNRHASDRSRVFVKVTASPGSGVHREPVAVRWAHDRGLCPVRPLAEEALHAGEMTLAAYERGEFSTPGSLIDQAAGLTRLLFRTHAATAPDGLTVLDPAHLVLVTDQRLGTFDSPTADLLRKEVRKAATVLASRVDRDRYVPVHGDAHVGNLVGMVNGTCLLVDWESFMLAPAEWDFGQFVRTLLVQQPTRTRAYRLRVTDSVLSATSHLDADLIDAVMRVRACTGASLLLHRNDPAGHRLLLDAVDMARLGLDFVDRERHALAA